LTEELKTLPCKCSIIGCGDVGAAIVLLLSSAGIFSEIVLIDPDTQKAEALASDMAAALPYLPSVNVYRGDLSDICDCKLIIITTADATSSIVKIKCVTSDAVIIIAASVCESDIYNVIKASEYPSKRIISIGTFLQTSRLELMIANNLGVNRHSVHVPIVGAYGTNGIALWSCANVCGVPLNKYFDLCVHDFDKALPPVFVQDILNDNTKVCHAVAFAVRELADAVISDSDRIMTVCACAEGAYGLPDVCISLPCVIGRCGIKRILEMPLSSDEEEKLCRLATKLSEKSNN
jgi:L-lactate dehydrogenase